ncbi:MAG: GNAT family protein [Candidatus Bipolaricaulota bacterium]|nr:GNAT family protein [Candidatus Bipolaricaulota bacterium]
MDNAKRTMPYRVETERLVLRCWQPDDARLLKEAVDSSLDHLRPWMPWAVYEPQSVEAKADRLRIFRGGILSRDERLAVGSSGLHTRLDAGGLEIGYWIRASHVGRGLATEAASALVKVAFEIAKVERVEIHCRPDNVASAAVPRKLGFTHEATRRELSRDADGTPHDSMVWTLLAREYPESSASKAAIAAYDAVGKRLL